jgi:GDP/UDP-N,N'-diacetylbacillosamine 2-epimerase (hydrolysing)
MKKIAVLTGTRAEYGILHPVLKAIKAQQDLKLQLVVTGMHLSHQFGYTVSEIIKDGFKISSRVAMTATDDNLSAMSKSIGQGVIGMTQTWEQLEPDVILILGDRIEPLAAAISGAYMNIPVAHIHGGDSSTGGLDEYARHAITKLAHIHFPATNQSAARIIQMGEDEWRVHMVGSPALDAILHEPLVPPQIIAKRLDIDLLKPLVLVVQHPVTTEPNQSSEQMTETMEAVVKIGHPAIVFYPNSDAGGRAIIDVINNYIKKFPFIKTIPSLPRREYLSLLKAASALVGNSSSAIIDAPSLGIPAVSVGIRQEGRERGYNVIDVGYRREEIVKAIKKTLTDSEFIREVKKCKSPYGDGKASIRIVEILKGTEKTPSLLQKKITY